MVHITEEISLDGIDYTIVITYDNKYYEKAPITIYINQQGNVEMGDYIYTIASYSTYLRNVTNNDQIKSLNQLLAKKYNVPIFLNISGNLNCSIVDMFKSISDLIDTHNT
ncbi:hypothetical protein SBY92_003781 [Candida maltosa Xu316]